jgi:hypothetical protein
MYSAKEVVSMAVGDNTDRSISTAQEEQSDSQSSVTQEHVDLSAVYEQQSKDSNLIAQAEEKTSAVYAEHHNDETAIMQNQDNLPAVVEEPDLAIRIPEEISDLHEEPDEDQTLIMQDQDNLPVSVEEPGPGPVSATVAPEEISDTAEEPMLTLPVKDDLSLFREDEDEEPTLTLPVWGNLSVAQEQQGVQQAVATESLNGTSVAKKEPSEGRVVITRTGDNFPAPFTPKPAPLKPPARYRSLFRILLLLLIVVFIFAAVRLDTTLRASDDQLLVQIGNQSPATVDLNQSFPVSPYLFGVNTFPEIGTRSLDQEHTGFMSYSPLVANGLQDAHIKLLRFPGGTWGEQHLLSYDQLNAFSTLLSQTGTEGMIQARLSGPVGHSGQYVSSLLNRATLAGDWVDYMNNPHSSFRTGPYAHSPYHPVKFWAVGDEPDHLINPDTGKPFTVAEYVNDFILFSTKMHLSDPTIQVFGPEISEFDGLGVGPTDANGQLWMEAFLKGVGNYEKAHPELKFHLLDGVSFHFYPFASAGKAPAALLSSPEEWNYLLPPLRQLIREDLGRDAPIAVTEINTSPTKTVYSRGMSALWWADTLGSMMNQGVENAAFFAAEGVDTPYPLFSSNGFHQTPMLRIMQLFANLQNNLIPVATQHDPISFYATQDDTHQTVSLLFVNKSAEVQRTQVSPINSFLGVSNWHSLDISLYSYSITVITLHSGGKAIANSYDAPANDNAAVDPLTFTVCGHKTDALANYIPC